MAELNIGSLQMQITADGSAALQEIDKVTKSAEGAAKAAQKAGVSGQSAGQSAAQGASQASQAYTAAGRSAQDAGSAASRAAEESRAAWEKTAQTLQNVGSAMSKMITVPVVAAMTASVAGASDLTETLGKTEVVFSDMSDTVLKWSQNSVQAMGLAQGSALEFASTYGDMATGMGLTIDKATEMSMNLTQLAADMASFKNIRTDVAAQKLNAIFTGETEGLKSLGIVMNQTNLQAFALSQGISKQVSAMSQQEQVMLRYQFVMNATKNAQGDFVRTGDSFANQTRKLGETIKQVGEAFGSQLLPMITPIVEKIQQFVQHIGELDAGTKNMILSVAAVAAAVGPLLLVGGKLITFLSTLKAALAGLAINPVVLALAGLAAAVAGVIALKKALDNANGTIDNTDDKYEKLKRTIEGGAEGEVKITGDASDVLTAAAEVVQELLKPQYYGKLAIDGDPDKAQRKLEEVQELIRKAEESVTIDGNGNKVIGDSGVLADIRQKIKDLDAMVVITDDPKERAQLMLRIAQLKNALRDIEGKVVITEGADGSKTLADIETERAGLQKKLDDLKGKYEIAQDPVNKRSLAKEIADTEKRLKDLQGQYAIEEDPIKKRDLEIRIGEVQKDLDGLKGEYEIMQAAGNKDDLQGEIDAAQDQLNALDAIIAFTLGEIPEEDLKIKRDKLQGKLEALQIKLETLPEDSIQYKAVYDQITGLKNAIAQIDKVIVSYELQQQQELDDYMAKLEQLGVEKTYTTTGEFVYTPETAELIQEYSDALAQAALATGNYKDAVENLNKVTDKRYGEKIQQVQEQATDAAEAVIREYNTAKGTEAEFSEKELFDRIAKIKEEAEKEIAELEAQREADKKANEIFNNGKKEDDAEAWARQLQDLVGDQGMTKEDILNKDYYVANAVKEGTAGEDPKAKADAQLVYADAIQTTAKQLADLQDAQAAYDAEVESANQGLEQAQDTYDKQTKSLNEYQEAAQMALNQMTAFQNPTDERFQGKSETEVANILSGIEGDRQAAEAALDAAKQKAEETKQAAAEALMETVSGIESASGKSGQELQTQLDMASQLGVAVTDAAQTAIVEGQNVISNLVNQLNGGVDIDSALTEAVGTLSGFQSALTTSSTSAMTAAKTAMETGGTEAGGAADTGMANGMEANKNTVLNKARSIAQEAVRIIKEALKIESPSKVMRDEVGKMIPAGIAVGVESGTPAALTSIRKSTSSLISGATSVLNGRAFTAPALAGAAPGINYGAMGDAMTKAMGKVSFGFRVGDVELAKATRDASSQQIALRAEQISRGYGGK